MKTTTGTYRRKLYVLAALAASALVAGCAACQPNPGPGPKPGQTGGVASFGGSAPVVTGGTAGAAAGGESTGGKATAGKPSGTIEERACVAASAKCGVEYAECLWQVAQLRKATYATLSDASLQCWIDQPTKAAIVATCKSTGVCR